MFSALSENHGNLNSKLSTFIALAPVASFKHQESRKEIEGLHVLLKKVKKITNMFGFYELGPSLLVSKVVESALWPFVPKAIH